MKFMTTCLNMSAEFWGHESKVKNICRKYMIWRVSLDIKLLYNKLSWATTDAQGTQSPFIYLGTTQCLDGKHRYWQWFWVGQVFAYKSATEFNFLHLCSSNINNSQTAETVIPMTTDHEKITDNPNALSVLTAIWCTMPNGLGYNECGTIRMH
jgi:hypothetical protein